VVHKQKISGLGMHTVHQLASTPNVIVFMGESGDKGQMSMLNWSQRFKGSRKIAAAKEALAGFASDVHPASTVVPVQLGITDGKSITAAHATIANYLNTKGLRGLDVPIKKSACLPLPQDTLLSLVT
jgi:hypothetical protein